MDAVKNPYTPGAGTPPQELAGRDLIIEEARVNLERTKLSRSAQPMVLVGLRGVGKTVLLRELWKKADSDGITAVFIEARENTDFMRVLLPELRQALLKIDRIKAIGDAAKKSWSVLRNVFSTFKIAYEGVTVSHEAPSDDELLGRAGDLELDLSALLRSIGETANEKGTAIALFVDELQYVPLKQLAALVAALHQCNQLQLPVTLIGAGLPQLRGNLGEAKSYSERLFKFHSIGPLPGPAARNALTIPAKHEAVEFEDAALDEILNQTRAYPYFLQEWGAKAWAVASVSPITLNDVKEATMLVIPHLDESFFAVRFDRCTPSERRYMRAMAEISDESIRSGEIAAKLGKTVNQVAMTRNILIKKGMIYSPAHGDNAFTVPMFAEYLKRRLPTF
jgi:AAA ATPase domain